MRTRLVSPRQGVRRRRIDIFAAPPATPPAFPGALLGRSRPIVTTLLRPEPAQRRRLSIALLFPPPATPPAFPGALLGRRGPGPVIAIPSLAPRQRSKLLLFTAGAAPPPPFPAALTGRARHQVAIALLPPKQRRRLPVSVLFPPAAGIAQTLTWFLEADLDRNGSYETSLGQYLLHWADGLSLRRGINADGAYTASSLGLTLSNTTGAFTPELSTSLLFGKIYPSVPVRLRSEFLGIQRTLWQGYLVDLDLEYTHLGGGFAQAHLSAEDLLGLLGHYRDLSATVSTTRRSDQAISTILGNIGLTASDYSLAVGQQTLSLHFAAGDEAISSLMEAVRSEMGGYLWVGADGKIHFEARNTRLRTTADDTWGDGTEVVPLRETYSGRLRDLITEVSVEVTPIQTGPSPRAISQQGRGSGLGDSPSIAPGQTYIAAQRYVTPGSTIITPVSGTDYTGNTQAGGGGADRTSSLAVAVTDEGGRSQVQFTNNHATDTVYLTKFQLRGDWRAPQPAGGTPAFVVKKTIPGLKTDNSISLTLRFVDDSPTTSPKARDFAMHLLRLGRYETPWIALTFDWDNDPTRSAMLNAEIGDLIAYKNTAQGVWASNVDEKWYVEAIQHDIRVPGVPRSQVTLAPSYAYRNLDQIIYDDFQRANGALGKTTNNKTWLTVGNVAVASNVAKSSNAAAQTPNIDLTKTDLVTEADLGALASLEATGRIGLLYRYTDTSNYWRVYIDKGTGKLVLESVVAGVATIVAQPAYTIGATAELRVIVQGNRHRVWADRKLYIDTTDAALNTQTKCGLYCVNTTVATWNDYFAEALT